MHQELTLELIINFTGVGDGRGEGQKRNRRGERGEGRKGQDRKERETVGILTILCKYEKQVGSNLCQTSRKQTWAEKFSAQIKVGVGLGVRP